MCNFHSHPSTLNSSLILVSSFYQHHVKHTHPNKSIWFLREYNELSESRRIGFHICTSVHKHSSTLVHVSAGAWNNNLQVFISCLTQYLCLSLCAVPGEAARGRVCVCESQPQYTEQPELLTEYTAQLRCQWRWLWSALKCCSSAKVTCKYDTLLTHPLSFQAMCSFYCNLTALIMNFSAFSIPFNCLVSYLPC